MSDSSVAGGYSELLQRHAWHWFATLTFSPTQWRTDKYTGQRVAVDRFHPLRGMHLEAADKAFRWWVNSLNATLYGGRHWPRKVAHGGVVWARGQEFHKSGRVHFHALLAAPDGDLNRLASRYHWHELWFREFGRNRIEQPQSQDDVAGYVSKYVTKDGEVDFSRNFGQVDPPRLFDAVQDRTVGVLAKPPTPNAAEPPAGGSRQGEASAARLSLTLPVRPAQLLFTDQTFFETTTET